MPPPNLLFLMTDQCQAAVFDPDHPCRTPNLDALIERGVRFTRATTPNAICSPARASLMTGLLPHHHGVLTVTHVVDDDQAVLREERRHWAQELKAAGYRTGYFGKTHIERSGDFGRFGWDVCIETGDQRVRKREAELREEFPDDWTLEYWLDRPEGYPSQRFYGATDRPHEASKGSLVCDFAGEFLESALQDPGKPWCCFVSLTEPHDPFFCSTKTLETYPIEEIPLAASVNDPGDAQPNLYRKAARVYSGMTERQKREAAACYYASITEIDAWFGRLLDRVEDAGQLENTVIVYTTDHGELLGAHGLYCKNIGAFEEVYNIPLIMAGPGIAKGATTRARVGLHDLAPTLVELAGATPLDVGCDSRSFAEVLRDPEGTEDRYREGYAEYFGGRYWLTQRIVWEDDWKFVFNGFDFDELYDLGSDPGERRNLADRPEHADRLRRMNALLWRKIADTGDTSLLKSFYPALRLGTFGPEIRAEPAE